MLEIKCPECQKMLRIKQLKPAVYCPYCRSLINLAGNGDDDEGAPLKLETEAAAPAAPQPQPISQTPKAVAPEGAALDAVEVVGDDLAPPKNLKPVIFGSIGAVVIITIVVVVMQMKASAAMEQHLQNVRRKFSEITPDNAAEAVASARFVMDKAGRGSEDYNEAAFKLGVAYARNNDHGKALDQFRICQDNGIHPLESAVFTADIEFRKGNKSKARFFVAKLVEQLESGKISGELGRITAELYAELAVDDEETSLADRAALVSRLKDAYPLSTRIPEIHAGLKEAVTVVEEAARMEARAKLAAAYTDILNGLVPDMREGEKLFNDGAYVEAFPVLDRAVQGLKELPFSDDGIDSADETAFKIAYEAVIVKDNNYEFKLPHAELLAFAKQIKQKHKQLPDILRSKNYVFRNGSWEKMDQEIALTHGGDDMGRTDLTNVVKSLVQKQIDQLALEPEKAEKTVVITDRKDRYVGDVMAEDNAALTIKTMLGTLRLMKVSIKERTKEMLPTPHNELKTQLEAALASPETLALLKEAGKFARNNRMSGAVNEILHCILYLAPRNLETINLLKYENVVLVSCVICKGKGYTKAGEKKDCTTCEGKGKVKCTRCGATGKSACKECIKFGANRGHIAVKEKKGRRVVMRYKLCPDCGGQLKVNCTSCHRGYKSTDCRTCKGEGVIWKIKPTYCTTCKGKRRDFDKEYLANPYKFLLGIKNN
ncbi:hypothetical protein ACFL4W_01765 [Planctomycetota bacterium]